MKTKNYTTLKLNSETGVQDANIVNTIQIKCKIF